MPTIIQEMPKIPETIPETMVNARRKDALDIIKNVTAHESLRDLAERFLEKWGAK